MSTPFHPLLVAAFPILFLIAHNRDVASPSEAIAPLAVTIAAVLVLLVVGTRVTHRPHKVAAVVSAAAFFFFTYGHAWTVVHNDAVLAIVFGATFLTIVGATMRTRRALTDLTRVLNVVALGLVLTAVVSLATDALRTRPAVADAPARPILEPPAEPRDIYYLIFDRYADSITLQEHFGFDNSAFLDTLRGRGFEVTRHSIANYQNTHMSLASSLNYDHLDHLLRDVPRPSRNLEPIFDTIKRSEVARQLRAVGYRYIHVGSWAEFTASSPIADVNLRPVRSSEFRRTLYGSTALSPVLRTAVTDEDVTQRDATLGALHQLDRAMEMDGPKFVFAHFILPHPPYVFDRSGVARLGQERKGNVAGYLEAVRYANAQIERITSKLLDVPEAKQPIIVLQSDEGPYPRLTTSFPKSWTAEPKADVRVKYGILNALRLPGPNGSSAVYDTMTPVNTFRVIFNRYFGTELPMLADTPYAIVDKKDAYTLAPMDDVASTAPASFVP